MIHTVSRRLFQGHWLRLWVVYWKPKTTKLSLLVFWVRPLATCALGVLYHSHPCTLTLNKIPLCCNVPVPILCQRLVLFFLRKARAVLQILSCSDICAGNSSLSSRCLRSIHITSRWVHFSNPHHMGLLLRLLPWQPTPFAEAHKAQSLVFYTPMRNTRAEKPSRLDSEPGFEP